MYFQSVHQEILCEVDLNGGSKIPSIYCNPLLSALDLTSSIFSGLNPALILVRAKLWIFEYTRFD